jgi:predicted nucleotidyltransferase
MDDSIDVPMGEIKQDWRDVGVDEISSSTRRELKDVILELFCTVIERYSDKEISVEEIIICGSYAEETAIKHFSDLDIRLVVTELPSESVHSEIQDYFKREYDARDDCFGYLDVQCHTESLPSKYPRIYES